MKQDEISLLYSYIYNNLVRLEDNVKHLQSNLRFRKIDIVDCMELACAIQELETFKEVTEHLKILLNLGGRKNVDSEKKV